MAADPRIKKAIVYAKDLAAMNITKRDNNDETKYHFRFRVKSAQDDTKTTPWSIKYAVDAKNISAIVGTVPYSIIITPAKRSVNVNISNKTESDANNIAVITTASDHGMIPSTNGNYVQISGINSQIVGLYEVVQVINSTSFSILKQGVTSSSVTNTQVSSIVPKRVEVKWGTENTTNILNKNFDVFVRWSYTNYGDTENAEWIYQATTQSSSAFEIPINATFMQIFVQVETFPHKQTDIAKVFESDIIATTPITDGGRI